MPPYNVTPGYDPGYALPANAKAEGVERRALVTKWMPRGTYDASMNSATGGYAQPKYVMDEPHGQGAYVTSWVPSKTYMGPRVPQWMSRRTHLTLGPATQDGGQYVSIQRGMGDAGSTVGEDRFPEPYHSYGQRAATLILQRVRSLPMKDRKPVLQRVLRAIDPTLWSRTTEITRRLMNKGVPAQQALHGGIARAMSAGMIAELHHIGKSGTVAPRSQAGMGCYGCGAVVAALGDTATTGAIMTNLVAVLPSSGSTSTTPQKGQCTSDGAFIWDIAADGTGFWRRLRVGEQCASLTSLSSGQTRTGGGGGITGDLSTKPPMSQVAMINVGPFALPRVPTSQKGSGLITHNFYETANLLDSPWIPGDLKSFFADKFANGVKKDSTYCTVKYPAPYKSQASCPWDLGLLLRERGMPQADRTVVSLQKYGSEAAGAVSWTGQTYPQGAYYDHFDWLAAFGIAPNDQLTSAGGVVVPAMRGAFEWFDSNDKRDPLFRGPKLPFADAMPIVRFHHPDFDEDWGVYLHLLKMDPSSPIGMGNSVYFQLEFHHIPKDSWYTQLLDAVAFVPAKIGQYVTDATTVIAQGLGDLACAVLSNPMAVKGATAAGGAAAGAGAAVGQAICNGGQPPPGPARSSSWLPLALGVGAGLVGLALLAKPKKKPPPVTP